ncbi:hypothetical protein QIS99_26185 [Streptomyces sp. B-S-A8]|uniref:Uncharacterized protein n=1 Tax=Streptomyces solicavernae TaxID=3043614 RepID=A0ABT6RYZ9_9ACTN|nr:hypothetical protein [Streptomyces sp. B-S-A8]MDI3389650.1 hypothetical protein [Streptomyces sp. B-S-A8]
MIRIVTKKRLALLESDTAAAFERARLATEAAKTASGRHADELSTATGRAERAEATAQEGGVLLSHAVQELSTAQQDLLLKHIELERLRDELAEAREPAREVFVLMHYGIPCMVYGSCEDAYADTPTHGAPADRWGPAQRFWADAEWFLATFTYDVASRGFRGALTPVAQPVGGAA